MSSLHHSGADRSVGDHLTRYSKTRERLAPKPAAAPRPAPRPARVEEEAPAQSFIAPQQGGSPLFTVHQAEQVRELWQSLGFRNVQAQAREVVVTATAELSVHIRKSGVSFDGVSNDQVLSASLEHVKRFWGGRMKVSEHCSDDFKLRSWAHARAAEVQISNYAPPPERQAEADALVAQLRGRSAAPPMARAEPYAAEPYAEPDLDADFDPESEVDPATAFDPGMDEAADQVADQAFDGPDHALPVAEPDMVAAALPPAPRMAPSLRLAPLPGSPRRAPLPNAPPRARSAARALAPRPVPMADVQDETGLAGQLRDARKTLPSFHFMPA